MLLLNWSSSRYQPALSPAMASHASSTAAAASTLTRPRVAVAVFSALSAATLGYYYFRYATASSLSAAPVSTSAPGLRRRNAVRRSRHGHLDDSGSDYEEPPHHPLRESTTHSHLDADGAADSLTPNTHVDDDDLTWLPANDLHSHSHNSHRTGENIVTLLFRVSEDNARRNACIHRGCQCNGCGAVPIRGIRYRCANCADFDLCEICEAQGLHTKTHIFYKVRIPAPPFGPRLVQPAWYPGDPDTALRQLPRHLLAKWSRETGFERVELDAFWEQWTFMANTEWRDDPDGLGLAMDRKTFDRCLVPSGGYRHASPNLIHDRMFAFYDTNGDGLIGFYEFLIGLSYRKRPDKLRRTFAGYDMDQDGLVDRRDFLRVFRAYYVLYKHMHRDILDGLDGHMMTTTEAQSLVQSRQPLSSLFGRDNIGPADRDRPLEGKVSYSNGDVHVVDGADPVAPDAHDTADREHILSDLFGHQSSNQSLFTESFAHSSTSQPRDSNSRYWTGVVHPPQALGDLSTLVSRHGGSYIDVEDLFDTTRYSSLPEGVYSEYPSNSHPEEPQADSESETSSNAQGEVSENFAGNDNSTRGNSGSSRDAQEPRDEAATSQMPPPLPMPDGVSADTISIYQHQNMGLRRSGQEKRKRTAARRQLLERWKRRQFYLDEEEGAHAPQGWEDSQDVLADPYDMAGPSFSAQSRRSANAGSGSSSRVKFVEETDDPETKPDFTSSRGETGQRSDMEIPEAERDAGKEILYQITQQAFNELLDDVFKKKEDLAVRAAETRDLRQRYRAVLETINLEDEDDRSEADSAEQVSSWGEPSSNARTPARPRPPPQQSLQELLSISGYTVTPEANSSEGDGSAVPRPETASNEAEDRPELHRDPTLPQFRPNHAEAPPGQHRDRQTSSNHPRASATSERARVPTSKRGTAAESKISSVGTTERVPHSTLVTWKRLDLAEQEARQRGGWGRLTYDEFEEIFREHEFADSGRNRLDYLGIWIDFCIP